MVAAREPAAAVARLQGPAQRRRYGAGLAADIEWIACIVFRYPYQATVAGDTAHRIQRQALTVIELAEAGVVPGERFRGNVHHNLVALSRGQGLGAMTQSGFRQCRQRIGAALRESLRGFGRYRGNVI